MADEVDYDVLVIGSGAAGLCAAVAAHEQEAQRILVAESEGVVGGSSRLSGGIIMAAESRMQKEAGIQDSVEDLLHDYLTFTQYGAEPGPVTTLTRRSGQTVDWLQEHGVPIAAELIKTGVERGKRGHAVQGGVGRESSTRCSGTAGRTESTSRSAAASTGCSCGTVSSTASP